MSSRPPARQLPWTCATTGFRSCQSVNQSRMHARENWSVQSSRCWIGDPARVVAPRLDVARHLQVVAGAERLARALEQDQRHVRVLFGTPHRGHDVGAELEAQRVVDLGAVQRDDRDAVVDVVEDRLVFLGFGISHARYLLTRPCRGSARGSRAGSLAGRRRSACRPDSRRGRARAGPRRGGSRSRTPGARCR